MPRAASHSQSRPTKAKSKTPSRQKHETFFDILKQEHENVKEMFEQIEENEEMDVDERQDLFSEIKDALEAHMEAEESYFYPVLQENEDTHDLALESYEEHHVAKTVLNECSEMDEDDERWNAKLKVLKEVVTHHIEEEEKEIFKAAKKSLDREQIEEITKSIEQQLSTMQA